MNTEERLDCIDEKIGDLRESNARIEEQIKHLRESIVPLRKDILDQCKNEIKTLGWKSITTIVTALVTSLSALILHFLGKQ